jgi:hypothetical protein
MKEDKLNEQLERAEAHLQERKEALDAQYQGQAREDRNRRRLGSGCTEDRQSVFGDQATHSAG